MNFIRQWYEARAKREEAHAKNVAELRQKYMDYELCREHALILQNVYKKLFEIVSK